MAAAAASEEDADPLQSLHVALCVVYFEIKLDGFV